MIENFFFIVLRNDWITPFILFFKDIVSERKMTFNCFWIEFKKNLIFKNNFNLNVFPVFFNQINSTFIYLEFHLKTDLKLEKAAIKIWDFLALKIS